MLPPWSLTSVLLPCVLREWFIDFLKNSKCLILLIFLNAKIKWLNWRMVKVLFNPKILWCFLQCCKGHVLFCYYRRSESLSQPNSAVGMELTEGHHQDGHLCSRNQNSCSNVQDCGIFHHSLAVPLYLSLSPVPYYQSIWWWLGDCLPQGWILHQCLVNHSILPLAIGFGSKSRQGWMPSGIYLEADFSLDFSIQ